MSLIAAIALAFCLVELLATLLAHLRERAIQRGGGVRVEVQRRQAEADRATAEAALFAAVAALAVHEHRRRHDR